MARLPLDSATVDAAVYSLSLMPTNLKDIIREANRVLKPSGQLLVVEVASRFADYQSGSADRRGSLNVAKKGAGENGKEKVVNLDLQRFAADLKPYGFSLTASEPLPPNGFFTYLAFKKTGDAERLTPKSRLPEIVLKACLYKAR
ncbi:25S rRNA (adenine645-N1)-methyltransferase [Tyrophagus putrescentiae]|nr:25S rRNA (adenine645-N1)-methyltransferase [Tyrophagus putrescentiae]